MRNINFNEINDYSFIISSQFSILYLHLLVTGSSVILVMKSSKVELFNRSKQHSKITGIVILQLSFMFCAETKAHTNWPQKVVWKVIRTTGFSSVLGSDLKKLCAILRMGLGNVVSGALGGTRHSETTACHRGRGPGTGTVWFGQMMTQ